MEQEIQTNVEEKKFIRVIGKWMISIAIVLLCINTLCRLIDAEKSKEHIRVTGTVSKIQESTELVRTGKRMVNSSAYTVWIDFQPVGWIHEDGIVEDYADDIFSVGDTVPVLYPKDAIYEAYAAKKDWLTGAYLPVSKDYNMPLVISVILFIIGFLLYKNSLILEWYTHAGKNKRRID